jgi:hypothetical protein
LHPAFIPRAGQGRSVKLEEAGNVAAAQIAIAWILWWITTPAQEAC